MLWSVIPQLVCCNFLCSPQMSLPKLYARGLFTKYLLSYRFLAIFSINLVKNLGACGVLLFFFLVNIKEASYCYRMHSQKNINCLKPPHSEVNHTFERAAINNGFSKYIFALETSFPDVLKCKQLIYTNISV